MTTQERFIQPDDAQGDDEVARLVRLAGTNPIAAERLARVRTAVHGAWRDEYVARTRRRWLTVAGLLAAASVVMLLAIRDPIRTPAPVLVAHIDVATGSPAPFTTGGTVMSGSTVTTSAGTLAMTLTSGVHLRLDASSTARVDSATEIALERGAVYVDSAGAHPTRPGASPISIHTPAGLVRDIGTRFQVRIEARLDGPGIRIRVRDGQVRLTSANGVDARADAGEELFSRPDGSDRSIDRRPIAATGSEWAWAERAAPLFSVEGKTLGAFLDWVSREGAWTVTFADRRFSEAARAIVLHGKPELLKGLTPAEALDLVLPTCGLRHRIDGERAGDRAGDQRVSDPMTRRQSRRSLGEGGRLRRMVVLVFFLIVGWAAPGLLATASEPPGGHRLQTKYTGRPLGDVLREFQAAGLNIVFSSEIVPPTMKVLTEPKSVQPRTILDEILRPHRLQVRSGPGGALLVVRLRDMPTAPETPPVAVAGQVVAGASKAPVRHAIVTVLPAGEPRAVDQDGRFALTVPPGRFRVDVSASAFVSQRVDLTVVAGMSAIEIVLDPTPEFRESVTVSGREPTVSARGPEKAPPIVDLRDATVGTNFGEPMLRDIPNQRDLFALLAATPGITMPRVDVGGNTAGTQSSYRAYGLSGQSITTVDGVNITTGADGVGAYIDYGALAETKIAAAGNSADVPVAGAAVTAVIKSGSNTQHGEFYGDFKPGGSKQYAGAENFWRYRDINVQLSGPFMKDRLWYFTSFRQQAATLVTGMYDKPAAQGGTQGQPFNTDTTDYTIKLTHQLSRTSTLAFMTQWGRKYQPFRGGSGNTAYQFIAESTAVQNSWTEIGKGSYTRGISDRAMLDTSINFYASQFPLKAQTDKTPIIDDVTFFRIGGYNLPSFSQDQRWHYNATLTLYAANHDMKIGYMYQWYGPRFTSRGAPGPAGTVGHFVIATTEGVPTSFSTDNGPVWNRNVLENNAVFFQDKFQVMPRLTLNYGVRFDQYNSSYPEQRFGLNGNQPCADDNDCDFGPFVVKTVTPERHVVTFNNLVPRVALIYDLFGNSKTALKASWGRFSTNPAASLSALVNPIDLISRKYAWDNSYLTMDPAVAATRITPAYVATLQPIFGGAQLTPSAVDPKLTNSYTDEYTFGAEQEIASDLRGHVTVVRKRQRNTWNRLDRLRTFASYTPVPALDPGPDGLVNGGDDRTITVWETGVPPDATDYYLTNKPIGDTYSTVEFGVTKRMSDNWQLISGFDWTKRNLSSLFSEDPNVVFWNSNNTQTTGWTLKASGSYIFKKGILVGLSYRGMKGEPYGRSFTVTEQYLKLADPNRTTPLVQGNMTIIAEKAGTYHLPDINVIDVRVQKEFVIKKTQRLQLTVNLFNFTEAKTVTGVYQTTGPWFGQETNRLNGTVVRLGVRYTF